MATRQSFTAAQVLTAAEQNALATAMIAINAQTGASYTTVLADDGKLITVSNASANTLTIPPNSSVAYGIGTQINIAQLGAGQTTITAGAGVTLNSSGTKLKLKDQYSVATCVKTDTNTWFVVGNLSA
jgi:C4-dicarboxylate-specific signal transduction histidine kinase